MIARNERADRPLVVSMSDLAASGGYYIAMPAQVIVAQPSTLTGSIGIFGGKIVTGGVYEKLGAHIESTSIGRHAEINSPARPYNAGGADRSWRSSCRPSTISSSRRSPSRGTARRRRSTRSRRAASGPGAGEGRTAWSTSSAGSTARSRVAKQRAKIRRRQRRRAGRLSAAQELLRAADATSSAGRAIRSARQRVAGGEPVEGRARGAAR